MSAWSSAPSGLKASSAAAIRKPRSHWRASPSFRATVSLAIATGVAMTLMHGVDHLSKGAVNPADRPVNGDDSDEDVLAL
jgi:hypothetical protein